MIARLFAAVFLIGSTALAQREYPSPLIREEQTVIVDGKPEVWRLVWSSAPKLDHPCGPKSGVAALTCPCMDFAWAESGDLSLVRIRGGKEIDRVSVTQFFDEEFADTGRVAFVQRWRSSYKTDFKLSDEDDFVDIVRRRPSVGVIHFFDYDHDGSSTEFYLHTASNTCSRHEAGVVIGLSKDNRKLHAFGTAKNPSKPLYLQDNEWTALRRATRPVEVTDWTCGDHGAGEETTVNLHWSPAGIDGTRRTYSCPTERRRLLSEEPLN